MSDPLTEPGYLSPEQRAVVDGPGNVVLTACPGSGKTRTAAARFVVRAREGDRVAVASYTNAGVDELRHVITGELGHGVGSLHRLDTLHGLLTQFVLRPFAAPLIGTSRPLRLLDPGSVSATVRLGENSKRAALGRFRFRPDGSVTFRGATTDRPRGWTDDRVAAVGQDEARRGKTRMACSGQLTYDDAMYWSLRVLREVPGVAAAVAGRFDEILIDEAQDTSELQLACLHEIVATGRLRSLVLVGDTEQSIYSFQGASPEGLAELVRVRRLAPRSLTENHRSSQHLCDSAVHFCRRPRSDRAAGIHAAHPVRPELLFYEPGAVTSAVEAFRRRVTALGLSVADSAVLARRTDLVAALNGEDTGLRCQDRPRQLGRAVVARRDGTLTRHQLDAVEKIVSRAAWGLAGPDDPPAHRRLVRRAALRLLAEAPDLDLALGAWIKGSARVLRDVVAEVVEEPACRAGDVLGSNAGQDQIDARSFFTPARRVLVAETIHSVKGASRDAVLVVARAGRRTGEADGWSAHLRGEAGTPEQEEERRILFVALTRARRYAAIGLPSDTASTTVDSFVRAGFVVANVPAQSRT